MPTACPFPALVIDSASPEVVVGLACSAGEGTGSVWERRRDEAGIGVFAGVESVLRRAGAAFSDVRSLVFCEGPGSLLGIRIAAMAIRVWQTATAARSPTELPVFSYQSLALVAADLLESGTPCPLAVITDARRGAWNVLLVGEPSESPPVFRLPAEEIGILPETSFHPAGFAHWQAVPATVRSAPYRPERLFALDPGFPLLKPCAAPDAFLVEAPAYRKSAPGWAEGPFPKP